MNSAFPTRILILGASTRAAAHSAVRAGWSPICVDGFADADLRDVAEVVKVDCYPAGLRQAASQVPINVPWMYTGGLENHRDIVAAVCNSPAGKRELWGNDAQTLRAVRDPFQLHTALQKRGLPALDVRGDAVLPTIAEEWLIKSRRGSGGKGVKFLSSAPSPAAGQATYLQRFKQGEPISALYLASAAGASLLGVTCQLIGAPSAPFGYAGSLAPWPVSSQCRSVLQQVGECVFELCQRKTCGLRGLFGIDFILAEETPWLIEVNPRWTASAELLELHFGTSLLKRHRSACEGVDQSPLRLLSPGVSGLPGLPGVLGKQIVYATRPTMTSDATCWIRRPEFGSLPVVADIPEPGAHFLAGQPICTVFAQAETSAECRQQLARQERWFRETYTTILESS